MSGAGTVEFIADGVERAAARRLLVHGDEHAASGRASGHRSHHRARSGRMAVPRRRRRGAAARRRTRCRSTAMRSRRGSMPRIRSAASCRRPAGWSRWNSRRRGHPGRHRRRDGQRGHAFLRSDDRQADRARADARASARPACAARSSARSSPVRAPMWRSSRRSAAPAEFRAGTSTPVSSSAIAAALGAVPKGVDRAAAAFGAARLLEQDRERIARNLDRAPDAPASPWDAADGFQLSGARASAIAGPGRWRADARPRWHSVRPRKRCCGRRGRRP